MTCMVPVGRAKGATSEIGETAIVWLSSSTVNVTYLVTCQVATTAWRVCERTVRLAVQ